MGFPVRWPCRIAQWKRFPLFDWAKVENEKQKTLHSRRKQLKCLLPGLQKTVTRIVSESWPSPPKSFSSLWKSSEALNWQRFERYEDEAIATILLKLAKVLNQCCGCLNQKSMRNHSYQGSYGFELLIGLVFLRNESGEPTALQNEIRALSFKSWLSLTWG